MRTSSGMGHARVHWPGFHRGSKPLLQPRGRRRHGAGCRCSDSDAPEARCRAIMSASQNECGGQASACPPHPAYCCAHCMPSICRSCPAPQRQSAFAPLLLLERSLMSGGADARQRPKELRQRLQSCQRHQGCRPSPGDWRHCSPCCFPCWWPYAVAYR